MNTVVARVGIGFGMTAAAAFGGHKIGEAFNNTSPEEYAVVSDQFDQAKDEMVATANGHPCQKDIVAALSTTADLPKVGLSATFVERLLDGTCKDSGPTVNQDIAGKASERFEAVVSGAQDLNAATNSREYTLNEQAEGVVIGMVISGMFLAVGNALTFPTAKPTVPPVRGEFFG
jgi:hypothetical protein